MSWWRAITNERMEPGDPQSSVAAVRAGQSQDTTGYNPRSKIIEGGSWTRARPHFAHRLNVMLAA